MRYTKGHKWYALEQQEIVELERLGRKTKDGEFTTYRVITYAGDRGDFGHEWDTEEDILRDKLYMEELIASGDLGKPSLISMTLKHCPMFDEADLKTPPYN